MGLRWAKMDFKRPLKSFKVAKTCICKNPKKHYVFHGFWASKAAQDSLGRPKKAPKRRLKSSKGFKKVDPKMEPILTTFWTTFGALLEPILEPKSAPEGDQKWDHFWNHLRRISGVSRSRFRNYTRGVERLLELELYSPKKREGSKKLIIESGGPYMFFEHTRG